MVQIAIIIIILTCIAGMICFLLYQLMQIPGNKKINYEKQSLKKNSFLKGFLAMFLVILLFNFIIWLLI